MKRYVIASRTQAPLEALARRRQQMPGQWLAISAKVDLSLDVLRALTPRYVFFPHWSWMVPPAILDEFECVCFHMTDVPYGRGGTPLQNLIARGHTTTKLSALRMTAELDAGPVYAKRELGLDGTAEEIFARAADISLDLAQWIAETEPKPVTQTGAVTLFERRTPSQSAVPEAGSLRGLHDHIRMLDCDGYPYAFANIGAWRVEFRDAQLLDGAVEARVRIMPQDGAS